MIMAITFTFVRGCSTLLFSYEIFEIVAIMKRRLLLSFINQQVSITASTALFRPVGQMILLMVVVRG